MMDERKSCDRCAHAHICPVTNPLTPEIRIIVAMFFGNTKSELAAVCKQYLDVGGEGIRRMLGQASDGPWHESG